MLALSATYPEALAQQLTHYMRSPTFIRLNVTDPALLGKTNHSQPCYIILLPMMAVFFR